MLQCNYHPLIITVKANRMQVSDGQLLHVLTETKALLRGLTSKISSVTA